MKFFETFPECSPPSTVSKKNNNDTSPFSIKRCDGYNLAPFMPVLVLITRVIHWSIFPFAAAWNILKKLDS